MPNFNNCTFVHHLGQSPELRTSANGNTFATGAVAINDERDKDAKPLWLNFIAFGKTAEFICEFFHKGDPIALDGRLCPNTYTTKDGETRTVAQLRVTSAHFLGGKKDAQNSAAPASPRSSNSHTTTTPQESRTAPRSDPQDDLPF